MTLYRRAWTMQLRDGAEAEYDAAHAAIWPELADQMIADGIRQFHLFRDGQTVFAVQERAAPFPASGAAPSELTQKWWNAMARLMVSDPSGRPVRRDLKQVFDLEEAAARLEGSE